MHASCLRCAAFLLVVVVSLVLGMAAARAQPLPGPDPSTLAGPAGSGAGPAAGALPCPQGNLLKGAKILQVVGTTEPGPLTDDMVLPEGASRAVQLVAFEAPQAAITWDLGRDVPLRAVYFQGDAHASFQLGASTDAVSWQGPTIPSLPDATGLRSRVMRLEGLTARYLRLGGATGESPVATELQVFCDFREDWARDLRVIATDPEDASRVAAESWAERTWLELTGSAWLTERQANAVKLALSAFGAALLLLGALLERKRADGDDRAPPRTASEVPWYRRASTARAILLAAPFSWVWAAVTWAHGESTGWAAPALGAAGLLAAAMVGLLAVARRGPFFEAGPAAPTRAGLGRFRAVLLAALAVVCYGGYYNWGSYRFPQYVHYHDFFHYYTGAKYFRELGYTRLYHCASVAEAEDEEEGGRRRVEARTLRDLRTNAFVSGAAVLERQAECKERFSAERWAHFKRDVGFFRGFIGGERWERALRDHGYNASPLWAAVASPLANSAPDSEPFAGGGQGMGSGALGLIDPLLLLAAFGALAWAFGWQVACVGAVFFGCSPLSQYLWTGGSYIRQDWLAALVIGVCSIKKDRGLLGGALLAYAALLRIFPGFLLVPIALRAGFGLWKERRLDRSAARILAGAALAAAVLVPASSLVCGGLGAWPEFVQNTAKHASRASANLVGLPAMLSFRPSSSVEMLVDRSLPDPFAPVIAARSASFRELYPLYVLLVAACVAALAHAARGPRKPWILALSGMALIPVVDLSCYYYAFLAAAPALREERNDVPVLLLALASVFQALQLGIGATDVRSACASAFVVAFSAFLAWALARERRHPAASPEGEAESAS